MLAAVTGARFLGRQDFLDEAKWREYEVEQRNRPRAT